MTISERQASQRITRALDDIQDTARFESESRRVALVRVLAQVANDFKRLAANAVREGRPLDPVELIRLRTFVRQAIAAQAEQITSAAGESEAFIDFVIGSLVATHVGIVASSDGADAGRRARDEFYDRVRRVPQNVQDAVRRLRQRDLEIPDLIGVYEDDAAKAAALLLDSDQVFDRNGDEVSNDLFLLLLGQDIDYSQYDTTREELTPMRGLLYLGATVVVAETFNAMHAGSGRTLAALGLVRTGRWTLSARHSGLSSSPDACDDIAARDVGFGAGRYEVDRWPQPPHPYCGCFMSDVRAQELEAWLANLPENR